jgi:hypothetical protein
MAISSSATGLTTSLILIFIRYYLNQTEKKNRLAFCSDEKNLNFLAFIVKRICNSGPALQEILNLTREQKV